jgi:hypothetical protein
VPIWSIGAIGATFLLGKEKKVTKSATKRPKIVHVPIRRPYIIKKTTVKKPIVTVKKPTVHIEPDIGLDVKVHPIIKKLRSEGVTNIYTRTTEPTMLERKDLTRQEKIDNTVKIIETMKPENQDKFTNAVVKVNNCQCSIIQTDPITQVAVETVIQKRINLLKSAGFQFSGGR